MEEMEVLKQYVESLNLQGKSTLSDQDKLELIALLKEGCEDALASYVRKLNLTELQELVQDTQDV